MGMLMYGWRSSALPNNKFSEFLKIFLNTKDVIIRSKDMKPFFYKPMIFAGLFTGSRKEGLSLPAYFTFDHDWNGECENFHAIATKDYEQQRKQDRGNYVPE